MESRQEMHRIQREESKVRERQARDDMRQRGHLASEVRTQRVNYERKEKASRLAAKRKSDREASVRRKRQEVDEEAALRKNMRANNALAAGMKAERDRAEQARMREKQDLVRARVDAKKAASRIEAEVQQDGLKSKLEHDRSYAEGARAAKERAEADTGE